MGPELTEFFFYSRGIKNKNKILDAAFGRCIPSVDVSDEDVYQYNLDPRQLELLRKQLEKLVADKYEWSHPYTQCVMQNALYSIRNKFKHDSKICRKLKNFTEKPLADLVDESETDVRNLF